MKTPYIRKNNANEMRFATLFHAWGDLLVAREFAQQKSSDPWVEGMVTRWTIMMAWSCFELASHLVLGLDPNKEAELLSPGFWPNLDKTLKRKGFSAISRNQQPWVDWELIRKERHPFAHLGVGAGVISRAADAVLAVEECERAVKALFTHVRQSHPRWLTSTTDWPKSYPPFGNQERIGRSFLTSTYADTSEADPKAIRIAWVALDGTEYPNLYPEGHDWQPVLDKMLENLGAPIWGLRVYDLTQKFTEEPLLMWGGIH